MPTIAASLITAVSSETAFDAAHDYAKRKAWDPFIRSYRFLDCEKPENLKVGDRVWARAHNGLTMTVRYETIQRPRLVAMQMTRGPWFFRKFTGVWRFTPEAEGTRILFRYGFEIRRTFLPPLLNRPVAAALQRDIDRRIHALGRHLETPA